MPNQRYAASDIDIPAPGYRARRGGRRDPASFRLVAIAGGIGTALLLIVGAWSLRGHGHDTVPVIKADTSPIRVKPDNPGGMQIAGADDPLLSGERPGSAGAALAPPPETPAPAALQAAANEPAASPAASTPAIPPAAPPAPVAAAPLHPAAPRAAVAAAPVSAPAHPVEVQLAALTSEAAARQEWDRLSKRLPDLLGGKRPLIARTERNGHVFWRLRATGFADLGQAGTFCERARAKGAACSVASF